MVFIIKEAYQRAILYIINSIIRMQQLKSIVQSCKMSLLNERCTQDPQTQLLCGWSLVVKLQKAKIIVKKVHVYMLTLISLSMLMYNMHMTLCCQMWRCHRRGSRWAAGRCGSAPPRFRSSSLAPLMPRLGGSWWIVWMWCGSPTWAHCSGVWRVWRRTAEPAGKTHTLGMPSSRCAAWHTYMEESIVVSIYFCFYQCFICIVLSVYCLVPRDLHDHSM